MANCETCKNNEEIPQQSKDELAFAFSERMVKRLWITILILVFMLVGTNGAWLWYNSQFETVETITEEYQADASDGGNAIINGNGNVDIDG